MPKKNDQKEHLTKALVHDINSSLSALQGAMEVVNDEWRSNPELVEKVLPLTIEKIYQLQLQLKSFHQPRP